MICNSGYFMVYVFKKVFEINGNFIFNNLFVEMFPKIKNSLIAFLSKFFFTSCENIFFTPKTIIMAYNSCTKCIVLCKYLSKCCIE